MTEREARTAGPDDGEIERDAVVLDAFASLMALLEGQPSGIPRTQYLHEGRPEGWSDARAFALITWAEQWGWVAAVNGPDGIEIRPGERHWIEAGRAW